MLRKVQKTNDLGFLRIHRNPSLLFLSPPNYCQKFGNTFFFLEGETKKKCFSIEPLAENTILFPLPGSGAALSWTWASAVRAWHLSLLQEPDRACGSGFQNKLPDTMRSGLALLLESGCWSRFRVFAEKNLACGKLFTV